MTANGRATIKPRFFGEIIAFDSVGQPMNSVPGNENRGSDGVGSPKEQDILFRYNEQTRHNREKFIYAPTRRARIWVKDTIEWLDGHNGLVTALATVVVASLTYSISHRF